MKMIISFILFILITLPIIATELFEPVHLINPERVDINFDQYYCDNNLDIYKLKLEEYSFNVPLNIDYSNLYSSKKVSHKKEVKLDNFIIGLKSDNTFLPNQYTGTKTFFTQYKRDKISLQTSYINNPLTIFQSRGKGSLGISPEYRFNEHFAIRTNHFKNFLDRTRKNEILLNIQPLEDNILDFNISAGHVQSEIGNKPSSQIKFSTNYKF